MVQLALVRRRLFDEKRWSQRVNSDVSWCYAKLEHIVEFVERVVQIELC